MAIDLDTFVRLRPYLYHLTDRLNIDRVRRTRCLDPAAALLRAARRPDLIEAWRECSVIVPINGERVVLRDQEPLIEGRLRFSGGWTFSTLIREINSRVFFWPGDDAGPCGLGAQAFARKYQDSSLVMRAETASLLAGNPSRTPQFSRFNSGAAPRHRPQDHRRGPGLFVEPLDAAFPTRRVVEVAFSGRVVLPTETRVSMLADGAWSRCKWRLLS